jgi:pimeloyl-ACP methyl ester carboxylesterase
MPDTSAKYADLSWTNDIVTGVLALIEKEHLRRPAIITHFVTGTQVSLHLALKHLDKIGKMVIIGGSPYRYFAHQITRDSMDWEHEKILTPDQRAKLMEIFFAPKWFKTVTKRTWNSNMWTPDDYCKDSIKGASLFKTSAEVPVQIMIRYLLEWMAFDVSAEYKNIKTPTLVLMPDFKDVLYSGDSANAQSCKAPANKIYLKYFHTGEIWRKAKDAQNPAFTFKTVPDTRLFMWYDQPKAVFSFINNFIAQ